MTREEVEDAAEARGWTAATMTNLDTGECIGAIWKGEGQLYEAEGTDEDDALTKAWELALEAERTETWDMVPPSVLETGMSVTLAGVAFRVKRLEKGEDGRLSRALLTPQGWKHKGRPGERMMLWDGELWRVKVSRLSVILERVEDEGAKATQ